MPHATCTLFADETTVSLTRLTSRDYLYVMWAAFSIGNSQLLAAYPALIAGAKYVLQERFGALKSGQIKLETPRQPLRTSLAS